MNGTNTQTQNTTLTRQKGQTSFLGNQMTRGGQTYECPSQEYTVDNNEGVRLQADKRGLVKMT